MKNYRKSGNEILKYAIMSPMALFTILLILLIANAAYRFIPKLIFGLYGIAAEFVQNIVSVINFLVN